MCIAVKLYIRKQNVVTIISKRQSKAPNIVNCLIDSFIEAYELNGEVSFPLKIEIVENRGRQRAYRNNSGEEERS
jgi:hypothetical protein